MLPTKKDLVGHYYCVKIKLMCENTVFFDKKPSFNDCKNEVNATVYQNWEKSCLPTISKKSIETKLKMLLDMYHTIKHENGELKSLLLEKLFDLRSCKCILFNPVEQYGKIVCMCHATRKFR